MDKLFVMSGHDEREVYYLKGNTVCIGRSSENDIQIRDNFVSRRHLELKRRGPKYFVKDLGSTNGTFVNGKPIRPGAAVEVKEGNTVVIGMSVICLGEDSSDDVIAFINSIHSSKEFNDMGTTILKDPFLTP